MTEMSRFYSFFNPNLNNGKDWVRTNDDMDEIETVGGFTTTVRQLTVNELAITWAEEIAEYYFGPDGFDHSDVDELAKWIGPGGQEVAKELHRLLNI